MMLYYLNFCVEKICSPLIVLLLLLIIGFLVIFNMYNYDKLNQNINQEHNILLNKKLLYDIENNKNEIEELKKDLNELKKDLIELKKDSSELKKDYSNNKEITRKTFDSMEKLVDTSQTTYEDLCKLRLFCFNQYLSDKKSHGDIKLPSQNLFNICPEYVKNLNEIRRIYNNIHNNKIISKDNLDLILNKIDAWLFDNFKEFKDAINNWKGFNKFGNLNKIL